MAFDPLTAALNIGGKVVDHFFPDKAQQDAAKLELLKLAQTGELAQMTGQMEINKAEAATGNWFIAGWRPFVGWTCGLGLFSQFLIRPYVIALAHVDVPSLDLGTLMVLLSGMLGLTVARTAEKMQNAEGNR